MTELKATPGPWRYEAGRDGRPPYVIRGNEGGFLVVGMTANRQEADARLIAAAPELFEALSELLIAADNIGGEHVDGMGHLEDASISARAAIAKATGATK